MVSSEKELCKDLHGSRSGTGSRSEFWPLLSVVMPAWWRCYEFSWAINLFIVNIWVVPAEVKEVLASSLESWIIEVAAAASFRWILAANHPHSTSLWGLEGLFGLYRITGVVIASVWVIKSWGSDIKVSLSIANSILIWAEVGGFQNNSSGMAFSWNISCSSYFEARATFIEIPVITSKSGRNGSSSVVFGTILVVTWSSSQGVGMAIYFLILFTETTSTSTSRAVPVASCAGPSCIGSLGGYGT